MAVPAPAVFAKVTTVALSELSRLPFASRISAVRALAAPEATLAVLLAKVRWSAAPGVNVTPEVCVIATAPTLPLTVYDPAAVDAVSISVYAPLPLSVAVQSVVHADGNVPPEVESLIELPPAVRSFPCESFA